MYFRFEKREPKPVEYRTLADVPEAVRCVAATVNGWQAVFARRYDIAYQVGANNSLAVFPFAAAISLSVVRVLDQIPSPPLPKTLGDCEGGQCVKVAGGTWLYFRLGDSCYRWDNSRGIVDGAVTSRRSTVESLTDIWAVACEVE